MQYYQQVNPVLSMQRSAIITAPAVTIIAFAAVLTPSPNPGSGFSCSQSDLEYTTVIRFRVSQVANITLSCVYHES
jgi:hypothetical protein